MKKDIIIYNAGYRITLNGDPISNKGNLMSFTINNNGYPVIGVRVNGKRYNLNIHRLQAYQKFGDELLCNRR